MAKSGDELVNPVLPSQEPIRRDARGSSTPWREEGSMSPPSIMDNGGDEE
ncbi:MAG TPA: hypothetical protein VG127_07195 [Rubrobacteraceae bacterium]|jgi:hypothetical protein|nr:hypothetical protein [Rubrobacteraceae bacterium]